MFLVMNTPECLAFQGHRWTGGIPVGRANSRSLRLQSSVGNTNLLRASVVTF